MEGSATKSKKDEIGMRTDEARRRLLISAKRITERAVAKYEDLSQRSAYGNIREHLKKLIEEEKGCDSLIGEIIETGRTAKARLDTKDYEMFDHLLSGDSEQIDADDLDSVLISTIKTSKDMTGVFELAARVKAAEYEDAQTKEAFDSLRSCTLSIKRKAEQIYDEIHLEW